MFCNYPHKSHQNVHKWTQYLHKSNPIYVHLRNIKVFCNYPHRSHQNVQKSTQDLHKSNPIHIHLRNII
jgi:hypothetical protein